MLRETASTKGTGMTDNAPTIYPALSYNDAAAALGWLVDAFGFGVVMDMRNEDGTLGHGELSFGTGMIMLGQSKPDLGWVSPRDLPAVAQTIYAYAADPDGHCARARAAGAKIIREPYDTEYGSREYSALDPEGHTWSFGTYRPVPAVEAVEAQPAQR